MNLLSRLGAVLSKPNVQVTSTLSPEQQALHDENKKKLVDAYASDAVLTAKMYHAMMPDGLLQKMMQENNYLCVQWGSRKVARLLNLCRGMLDVEVHRDVEESESANRPTVEQQDHVLSLLFWMCWLVPIPIKSYMLRDDVDEHYKPIFRSWLVNEFAVLNDAECDLVLEGVFSGTSTVQGNVVLDIFHDALRFEESQFGVNCPDSLMRTELGKNRVFAVQSQRKSASNLTPHWMLHFQELKGIDHLVSKEASAKDEAYAEQDGIS